MYLNYRELDADIIIIGAELAGLSTAYYLLEKDPHIDFLILDIDKNLKSNELPNDQSSLWSLQWLSDDDNDAGLTRTRSKKVTFETKTTNFQFISGHQKELIKLLNKFEIQYGQNVLKVSSPFGKTVVDYNAIHYFHKKQQIFDFLNDQDEKTLNNFYKQIDKLSHGISFDKLNYEKNSEYDKISLQEFLQNSVDRQRIRDLISQTFLINCGVKPQDVSLLFYLAYCNSIQNVRNQFHKTKDGLYEHCIQNGSDKLSEAFRKIIGEDSIIKVSEINEISWDNSMAGIKTPQKYFFSNSIVFTLSESEIDEINFVPPLRRQNEGYFKRSSLKKFELLYNHPHWVELNLSGDVYVLNTENQHGPIQFCQNFYSNSFHFLTGLANKESTYVDILNQISYYFEGKAINPVEYSEYVGYSFLDAKYPVQFSTMRYHDDILKSFGRIIWANPESSTKWYGTMAGSVEAGFNGALRVLRENKPNVLNLEDIELLSPPEVTIQQRSLGLFGIKWHILVPSVIVAIFFIMKLIKFLKKK